MKKKIELDKDKLIEYNGDLYTPEELARILDATGEYRVVLRDNKDTWFGRAMAGLEENE